MTFANTFLSELYWMILQMTWTFAKPETGLKLMGEDKVYDFNPTLHYMYKPLSQGIETEYSKDQKIQRILTMFGYVANIPHPDTIKLINFMCSKVFLLMGDEFSQFADALLDMNKPMQTQGQGGQQALPAPGGGASNQYGAPQSVIEQGARSYGNAS